MQADELCGFKAQRAVALMVWVTCSQELPEQGAHSHDGRARTGRLCSLPAECILHISTSDHFLSQPALGVTMALHCGAG